MNQQTYSKYESGSLRLRVDQLAAFSRALDCEPAEILEGIMARKVAVTGLVGPGGVIWSVDEARWNGPREVECPHELEADNIEALIVQADAIVPLEHGSMVFVCKARRPEPNEILNKLCVVTLPDGERLLIQVRRGYTRGRFNLIAAQSGPREDVEIEEAGSVQMIAAPEIIKAA